MDAVSLGRHQHSRHARSFACKVAKDVDRPAHFTLSFGQRLAFFASHVGRDGLESAVEQFGALEQNVAARGAIRGGPGGQRSRGGIGGASYILRGAF